MEQSQSKISPEFIQKASQILKSLGHPDRLKIVEYLETGEKTVGQIHRELDLIQPIVSQHLKKMLEKGIVDFRQEGTRYYYSLANDFIIKILQCMSDAQDKIFKGEESFKVSNFQ